jgi:hypothetical protein
MVRDDVVLKKKDGSEVTNYSWRPSSNLRMTCWEKLHSFYIPNGLFGKNTNPLLKANLSPTNIGHLKFKNVCVGSKLNKIKMEALGKASKKRGRKPRTIEYDSQEDEHTENAAAIGMEALCMASNKRGRKPRTMASESQVDEDTENAAAIGVVGISFSI